VARVIDDVKSATLDTSAVITAFEPCRDGHPAMRRLIQASQAGQVRLVVSKRTLYELREKPDDKLAFAESLEILPYYMIGLWKDLDQDPIAWNDLAGTWDDAKVNQSLQEVLPVRARVKLRDRGIVIDSMQAGIELLVTTDSFLLDRANGIERVTRVRPVHPNEAASRLISFYP
jgi:hypothetical protein